MSGYFGDEATCARCDYPQRRHHLLRATHDYDASNENAPDAGQGIEGNANSIPTKEMSPDMNHTASIGLAELIGPDWSYLDDSERECLTVLHADGIRLDLIKHLAANTAADRRAELAVI